MHALSILALVPAMVHAADPLKLASKYQGSSFFDGWKFDNSSYDVANWGNIRYLDQQSAQSAQLVSVNSAGHAIIKIDNSTDIPGANATSLRSSVKVTSQEAISTGTLLVMDAVHIPYGCSVWPAFWTLDSVNGTDDGGEIDIVEAVNLMPYNKYSLHANPGCMLVSNASMPHTGSETFSNCDFTYNTTGNEGCGIQEKASKSSLGAAFAQNGGGAYAMYWTTNGIQIWFFERTEIPQDLTSDSPDPTSWSTPSASYPASGCDPAKFFNPQNIIVNIDICGSWAGNALVYNQTGCSGNCTQMVGTAKNYDNAYWEINYIKTFTVQGNASVTASPSGTASGHASGATGTKGSGSGAADGGVGTSAITLYISMVLVGIAAVLA